MKLQIKEYKNITNLLKYNNRINLIIGEIHNFITKEPICIVDDRYKLINSLSIIDIDTQIVNKDLVFISKEDFFKICLNNNNHLLDNYTIIIKNIDIYCVKHISKSIKTIIINNEVIDNYISKYKKEVSCVFLKKNKYILYNLANNKLFIRNTKLIKKYSAYNLIYILNNINDININENHVHSIYKFNNNLSIEDILINTLVICDFNISFHNLLSIFKGNYISNILKICII